MINKDLNHKQKIIAYKKIPQSFITFYFEPNAVMVESCFRRRHSSSLKTAKCFVINCILSPPIHLGRGLLDAESSPPPIPSPRTGKISENNGHAQPNCAWLLFLKSNWFSGGSACETDLILRLKGWDADFFWMEMWPPVTIHPSFI